jgi:uncharacterized protein YjiS (DUF1127 family)
MSAHVNIAHHSHHFSISYLLDYLRTMIAVRSQRQSLDRLDDHMLDDLGISRTEAQSEAARPAWDVPHYWMR